MLSLTVATMHYTLLVTLRNEEAFESARTILKAVHQQTENLTGYGRQKEMLGDAETDSDRDYTQSVFRLCCVDQQFEFISETEKDTKLSGWQGLTPENVERTFDLQMQASTLDQESSNKGKTRLSEHLHVLADELPYAGFTFDVFLVNPTLQKGSCASTLGSLMRLREWHGAAITVVGGGGGEHSPGGAGGGMLQFLTSVLHAPLLSPSSPTPTHPPPLWRGVVAWPSEKGFVEAGAFLQCLDLDRMHEKMNAVHYWKQKPGKIKKRPYIEDLDSELVLGRRLEVLTCLSLASIPLYLIDNFDLQLHMKPTSRFGKLVGLLTTEEALLLRLSVLEKDSVPPAANNGLSTAIWKEGIASTGRPTSDPEKENLSCRQHLFAVIPGGQTLCETLTAIVLRSPSEVNPKMFEELRQLSYFGFKNSSETSDSGPRSGDGEAGVEEAVQSLPLVDVSDFRAVDQALTQSTAHFINAEKKKSQEEGVDFAMTTGDLAQCVAAGQEMFLQSGAQQPPPEGGASKSWTHQDFIREPDVQGPPSEWPERRSLCAVESKAKVLRRYQSSDSCSLMMSSPLAPDDSSMDAKDMVRWFRPDGSAVQQCLSPVKAAVRPQRMCSHEERTMEWPACKDLQYHDVYYEHKKRHERQEQFYQHFRDSVMLEEGHHVCCDRPHVPALRWPRQDRPSRPKKDQTDYTSGGRKLMPRDRAMSSASSSSSLLALTPAAKQSRPSADRREERRASGERDRQGSQDDPQFPVPRSRVRQERRSSGKRESFGGAEQHGVSPYQPRVSTPTLPPFRKLSPTASSGSIFTPPTALARRHSQGLAGSSSAEREKAGVGRSTPSATVTSLGHDQDRRLSSESVDSQGSASEKDPVAKESRSQRHKRKLAEIVGGVLVEAGVPTGDALHASCFTKLYQVTKFFVQQLPNSRNLKGEMKSIAEKQVEQVVDLERRRQDLAVKKKLRKTSLAADK